MEYVTSKTHFLINIRYHASEYYMKKFDEEDNHIAHKKHMKAAQKYQEFKWEFAKKFLNIKQDEFTTTYGFSFNSECFDEEIKEKTGVEIFCASPVYTWCIPKNRTDIFNWIVKRLAFKLITHKVLKKTRGTFYNRPVSRYFRVLGYHSARAFEAKLKNIDIPYSDLKRVFIPKPSNDFHEFIRTIELRNVSCGVLNISDDFPIEGLSINVDHSTIDVTDSFFQNEIQKVSSEDATRILTHYLQSKKLKLKEA